MNVTDHCDGSGDVYDVALFHEQLFCFGAYCFDEWFGEELFAVELRDALVQVNACLEVLARTMEVRKLMSVPGRPGIAAHRYHVAETSESCKRSGSEDELNAALKA